MNIPSGRQRRSTGKVGLAHRQRKTAQIVAVHRQHIEGAELHLFTVLAGMQGIEIGDAIDAQDNGLTIDHKLPDAVLRADSAIHG